MNIPKYALVALGTFLYSTNIVIVPYKGGNQSPLGEDGV
jgi:hypothetical protein